MEETKKELIDRARSMGIKCNNTMTKDAILSLLGERFEDGQSDPYLENEDVQEQGKVRLYHQYGSVIDIESSKVEAHLNAGWRKEP